MNAASGDAPRLEPPVHFVGIAGTGMSGIARLMLARGIAVSGSDVKENRELAGLRALGARVYLGQDPHQLGDARTIVTSSAIPADNSEVVAARDRGLLILRRAEALAALMAGRQGVAVAGTHGKTTTTSMLTVGAQHCGADPSFAIGGLLAGAGVNAHDGSGTLFIAEADESDGSFLALSPRVAIVTNVEADHMDHYADLAAIEEAFDAFARRLPADGLLVSSADDPGARRLAEATRARGTEVRTFGTAADADVRLEDVVLLGQGSRARLVISGVRAGVLELQVPGIYNQLNAAAALTAGLWLGLPSTEMREGLSGFRGARRRFDPRGSAGGVRVFDDYAHHPTEIRAVLEAAREVARPGRVIAAFQPHRYSRTAAFRQDFGEALALADEVVVLEVYAAGEDPIPGASGASVAAAVPLPPERVVFEPSWSNVAALLASRARPGDLVLTLGAGDVTMIGPQVLEVLAAGHARGQQGEPS